MDKNLLNAINRLRGFNPRTGSASQESEDAFVQNIPATPPSAAPAQAAPEKNTALDNFLAQAPGQMPPESERKYTMEDLDRFIESMIKPE